MLPAVIDELAERRATRRRCSPTASALTYRALARASASVCAMGARRRVSRKGDVGRLLMPNRPEYMAIWLGITRVGGVVALLNTNLTGPSLAHCDQHRARRST